MVGELGGGEAPAEGDERDRPRRARGGDHSEDGAQDRREAGKGRARKRVGRPAECVRAVPVGIPSGAFLARFCKILNPRFDGIRKARDMERCLYEGQFATSLEIACLKDADDVCKWGRRRWDIESSSHVEKNGGYGLEHNFCNKARVSRNIYLLMQIAHNLWQLFNSTCLLPLQKKRRNRNMTQRKWVEVILQKLVARGIALALDELPRRYVSREFLTL